MRIVVMSDTHGETASIQQVRHYVGPVDAVFHCGDSELDNQHEVLENAFVVRGNCDWDSSFPEEVITEIKGVKIFMAHGHLYQVKSTLLPISYRSQEVGAELVLFGHSHLLGAEQIDGTVFVNPGSLEYPRGRVEKSYAIIEKSLEKWTVTFYSNEHETLDQATFKIAEK